MQFDDFIEILYQSEDGSVREDALNTRTLSLLERYTPPFHFIIEGKVCQPKVTITARDYGRAKFIEREILLGNGSSKAVMSLNNQAVFFPRAGLAEEDWLRIIKEEMQFAQAISQYNILTQDLSYQTVTIVDNKTNQRATIKVMVATDFNQYGQDNNGYVWDTKNDKKYGKEVLLFDNNKMNLTDINWVKAILNPLMRDLILCLIHEIPHGGDRLNYFIKNNAAHHAPNARLMLYDFSSLTRERECKLAQSITFPDIDQVVSKSEEALTKLFYSIGFQELTSLGYSATRGDRYKYFNTMRDFIESNSIARDLAAEVLAELKNMLTTKQTNSNDNDQDIEAEKTQSTGIFCNLQ